MWLGIGVFMTIFFQNLELCLQRRKLNYKELSILLDLTNATVTGWKQGSYPRADIACKIAKIFDVSVEWLITGEVENQKTINQSFTKDEEQLLENYRQCSEQNKKALLSLSENIKPIQEKNIADIG